MKYILRAVAAFLLLAFVLPAVYYPGWMTQVVAWIGLWLNVSALDVAIEVMAAAVAVWAFLEYRRSQDWARWLFLLTALFLLVLWAIELLCFASPNTRCILDPLVTPLNYFWGALVCAALLVSSLRRASHQPE